MKRYFDFDAFMGERERDTVEVTVLGRTYEIDASVPASVLVRMGRTAGGEMSPAEMEKAMLRAADQIFGREAVDQMCQDGLGADDFVELVCRIYLLLQGKEEEAMRKLPGDGTDAGEEFMDSEGVRSPKKLRPSASSTTGTR